MKKISQHKESVTIELTNSEFRVLAMLFLTIITGVNQWDQKDWDEFETESGYTEKDVRALHENWDNAFPLSDE